ncbi:MAG: sterol desaturase family protein [Saprospiraceae bacterium]|nr:sterol desaturase family protein [Saprospiraceae bacterium]
MDQVISYFTEIPSTHRSIILFGGLAFFMLIENVVPLFKTQYKKGQHLGLNLFFTFTTVLVNLSMAFALYVVSLWVAEYEFGIIHLINAPILVKMILAVMLLDLIGAWLIHFLEHRIKVLWMFHTIHHSDQHVDASTANRHHPGESVFRFLFTCLAVFISGAEVWMIMVYQSLSVILSQFNHSNINLPIWLDNGLKLLFVTPHMHRVHHHYKRPLSDKNFGNIFSLWDRLFRTYVVYDNSKLEYGLDTYMDKEDHSNIIKMLKIPFQAYRSPDDLD